MKSRLAAAAAERERENHMVIQVAFADQSLNNPIRHLQTKSFKRPLFFLYFFFFFHNLPLRPWQLTADWPAGSYLSPSVAVATTL